MQSHRIARVAAVFAAVAMPVAAHAQGFGVNEIGTCAASRAFAATGSACQDASTIFWNPAAAVGLDGWNVTAGAAIIDVGGSFTQDTTLREWEGIPPTAFVPHAFVNYHAAGSKLSYGLGFYVPYGLTSQWPDSFPGRFQAQKAAIATFYIQPNIAYQLTDKWSFGGGPIFAHSAVELVQGMDLSEQVASAGPPLVRFSQLGIPARTQFGTASLEGSATSFGAQVGAYGKLNPSWTVGIRYLTPITFEYDQADATFTQVNTNIVLPPGNPICSPSGTNPICGGDPNATVDVDLLLSGQFGTGGALVAQGVETKITHPAQVQAGVGYSGFANWVLSADYAWIGWKQFKELPVTFTGAAAAASRVLIEDYNNSSAIRVGAQRSFTNGAQLRAGFAGVASAAPDETVTPLLPEQDRGYASIGGEYPINEMVTLEGAYLKVFAAGKRGRITERASRTQTAEQLNSGLYELDANVFSFSLKLHF
jgi:long-chain fatty acid transport protein